MKKIKRILIGTVTGTLIGLIVAGSVLGLRLFLHERLPLGTSIANIDLSYDKTEKALQKLTKAENKFNEQFVSIFYNGESVEIKPVDLGIKVFPLESIQVIAIGDAKKTKITDFYKRDEKRKIDLIVQVDEEKLISKLNERIGLELIAPKPANFYFDETGKLAIKKEEEGMALKKEVLVAELIKQAKLLKTEPITLSFVQKGAELTAADLEPQIDSIQQKLNHNITLVDPVYSDDWNEKLIDHPDWVVFYPNRESRSVDIKINQAALNIFIDEEISKWLDDPTDPVTISMDENGKVIIEGESHDGMEIERGEFKNMIEVAVATLAEEITIPVKEIQPELNISNELIAMGIKERIGVGHTSFYGSPTNRVHNIKTATARFNGAIIAPGDIFSFNTILGPVDGSTGYRKELVIKPEGTIPEFGGGVCQVSTTMYRAALLTGLNIKERNQHTYAVSYYSQVMGHGLDATIYLGGPDLKWENDTGQNILVHSYVKDDYELYFVLYGTTDGRSVKMEGPFLSGYHGSGPTQYVETTTLAPGQQKQVEKSHTGFSANWYRYLTKADGEVIKEFIGTNYKAIPAKILVGVDPAVAPQEN